VGNTSGGPCNLAVDFQVDFFVTADGGYFWLSSIKLQIQRLLCGIVMVLLSLFIRIG